jgi:hypothetical protein
MRFVAVSGCSGPSAFSEIKGRTHPNRPWSDSTWQTAFERFAMSAPVARTLTLLCCEGLRVNRAIPIRPAVRRERCRRR